MNVSVFKDAEFQRIKTLTQPEEITILIANALQFIIENVFVYNSNSFIFAISAAAGPINFFLHDIMNKLFKNVGLMAVYLLVQQTKMDRIAINETYNMILIDSFKSLDDIKFPSYNQNHDNLEYYFIFLKTSEDKLMQEMNLIFRYCFNNYWLHCNIMVQSSKGEILVYTYFPFKENLCFQTQPELINRFVEDHFEFKEIFPDKLNNLYGCPMKVTTWVTPPFVVNRTNHHYPKLKITGFEMVTLSAISETMNFTLDMDWIPYYSNQSQDDRLLEKLKNFETNITMGFFRRTHYRNQFATSTIETFFVPMIIITLRKLATPKSMNILTFPFDIETWILMIVVYFITGLLSVFHTKPIKGNIFQTFAIIMGATIKDKTKTISTRLRLITVLLSSLILRSIYQSLLYFAFQINFYITPPYSLMGLASEGYKLVSTELTQHFLLFVPEIETKALPLIVTNSSSEMSPMRYMEFHRNESLVAVTILEFAFRYVYEELTIGTVLRILPIEVKDQQISFYLAKHSYLIDRFNDYIFRLHQSGLIEKWRDWTNMDFKVSSRLVVGSFNSDLIINLSHISGFLFFILFLQLTSLGIFGLELLSKKFKWLQKLF